MSVCLGEKKIPPLPFCHKTIAFHSWTRSNTCNGLFQAWILDSTQGFRITVIWILCKYLGFRIPVFSWIPGFFELYSAFHGPNFPGFRNLESLTRGDQMIRPWLRRAKGYPHPQRLPGAKTCYPRCKKNYTLSNNKKSLKEHFTNLLCIFPTSWLATGGEPDRRRKKIMTHEPMSNR